MSVFFIDNDSPTPYEQEVIAEANQNYDSDILHITPSKMIKATFEKGDKLYVTNMSLAISLFNELENVDVYYPWKLLVDCLAETKEVSAWIKAGKMHLDENEVK